MMTMTEDNDGVRHFHNNETDESFQNNEEQSSPPLSPITWRERNRSHLSSDRRRAHPHNHSAATAAAAIRSSSATREETLLFFISAVGSTLGWTSVLSNLVYYTQTLGVDSYLYLNVCIYAPLFPITIAQTLWDADFDRQFTSLKAFWWRGSVGFAITVIATQLMAKASEMQSLPFVSLLALLLGTASGILHGALKQMASFVYPGCGRLAAAVTAGLQASALLVLLISVLVTNHISSSSSSNHEYWLYIFYGSISIQILLCWIGFQRLMTHSRAVYRSMMRRDSFIQLATVSTSSFIRDDEDPLPPNDDGNDNVLLNHRQETDDNGKEGSDQDDAPLQLQQPLLVAQMSESTSFEDEPGFNTNNNNANDNNNAVQPSDTPTMIQTFYQVWPLCLAIFLTVASSMAVASWFNRVPSNHRNLPQVLFYTRLLADLLARPTTLLLPKPIYMNADTTVTNATSSILNTSVVSNRRRTLLTGLLTVTLVRLLFVPYFFWYATTTTASTSTLRGDVVMVMGVFGFAFSSGFVTTWVYQLAPSYGDHSARTQVTSDDSILLLQQTNVLNVWFSGSVLVGVVGSLILTR